MKRFLANFLSVILIPLLAPTYLYIIILFFFPQTAHVINLSDKLLAILYIALTTTLLPFIVVFILYKRKVISDLTLHRQEDRTIPQIFSCVIYLGISLFLVKQVGFSNPLALSMIAVTISVMFLTIITPFWKISTHACGAWGMFAILYVLQYRFYESNFVILYYVILASVIGVCLARLYLKVHTPLQVLAGSILGTAIGFSLFHFYLA
ncbi:phosphatase PAP2 family protein [Mucilaginibacter sp. HMF5004]|uniref:phosphatase PAP2 family protein n=1 Tax=Mucilaginibacter rivuli TaxID=2857527 RepID=UPI001C600DA0|nr:phosphatase PAP2 family protein [Mucilaginibacter rivuli]MBW4891507.1 phosphatase PAP2 family protein [Mucilaginibacter rivuli]